MTRELALAIIGWLEKALAMDDHHAMLSAAELKGVLSAAIEHDSYDSAIRVITQGPHPWPNYGQ